MRVESLELRDFTIGYGIQFQNIKGILLRAVRLKPIYIFRDSGLFLSFHRGVTTSVQERYAPGGRENRSRWEREPFPVGERTVPATVRARPNDRLRPPKRPFAPAQTTVRVGANDCPRRRKSFCSVGTNLKTVTYTCQFQPHSTYYYALDLVEYVYERVGHFPKEEKYALGDQIRRAVVSVPSNIVEGVGRATDKEKAHFISMAYSSLMEVLCQMEIAYKVHYISEDEFRTAGNRIETVAKMLSGLRNTFVKSLNSQP